MNFWHDVDPGNKEVLKVVVEIPKLSRTKYELDKKTGLIKFDRALSSSLYYPINYGFVPKTLWEDGDPLDVLILASKPLISGDIVEVHPIGVLEMNDNGKDDIKIFTIPIIDQSFSKIKNIEDVEPHLLHEIKHFFTVYKDTQKKKVIVGEWKDKKDALEVIEKSFTLYKEKYGS